MKEHGSLEVVAHFGNLKCVFHLHKNPYLTGNRCGTYPHDHGNLYELRYTSAGHTTQIVNDVPYQLSAGDLLLIQPHECHCMRLVDISADLAQFSIRFFFRPPSENDNRIVHKAYEELTEILRTTRIVQDKQMTLLPLWECLKREFLERNYGYNNYLSAYPTLILTEMLRLIPEKSQKLFYISDNEQTLYMRDKIDSLLVSRFMENLKREDVAREVGLSPRQLSRIFIREFGVSFITKLNSIRLQQAKFQLKYTKKDIARVCLDCGFHSYSYFISCFKKNTGMTPSDYRASKTKEP